MISLPVLNGYCTIQLYKKIGGDNFHPDSIIWEICGNTLVSVTWWLVLNQERWRLMGGGKYVGRIIVINRKIISISMSREILGLPVGVGRGCDEADHKNHDTFDNTCDNLRIATSVQSKRNLRKHGSTCRFKGVYRSRQGFASRVRYNGKRLWFGYFKTDVEAALVHLYVGNLVHDEYFYGSVIPEDEMPTEECQEELWKMVLTKMRKIGFLVEV